MKTVDLGKVTIDRIVEIERQFVDPFWFYKNIDQEVLDRQADWLGPQLYDPKTNQLAIGFHSFLIRANGLNILVDTCNGNHKERAKPEMHWQHQLKLTQYQADLAAQGLSFDDIDIVMCTHLHTDHVGWNTVLEDGRWIPTFKNAKYIFSKQEFDHHVARQAATPDVPTGHGSFADSVLPVVEAGLVQFVDNNFKLFHELEENVYLEPSPGHTPGHVCVCVNGHKGEALITGDAIHHPIQLREKHLINVGDFDHDLATKTRYEILDRCAENRTLMLTCHFPTPTAGYVRKVGDLYDFDYNT